MSSPAPQPGVNKRLCVLSDGTWNSPESPTESNIVRLTRSIARVDDAGVHQMVMYDRGIGTAGGADRIMGGAFGDGIDQNIEELYTFLALNYIAGDEIYMFGFSRGAYTVRSLAGMIDSVGLVRRDSLEKIKDAYELYRADIPSNKDSAKDRAEFRAKHGDRVPVECVACFDTVGSLGIPESLGWLNGLTRSRYEFHDIKLSPGVVHAIHAVAIDEDRAILKPTLMIPADGHPNQVTQYFFWGSHGGIGGSETTEPETANITLRFVVDEIKLRGMGLQFNMEHDDLPKSYPTAAIDKRLSAGRTGPIAFISRLTGSEYIRKIEDAANVHFTAAERFQKMADWRPKALDPVAAALDIEDVAKIRAEQLKIDLS